MDDDSINEQSTTQDEESAGSRPAASALEMVPCPNCQQPLDVHDYHHSIHCPLCAFDFALNGHTCPACYHYHEKETAVCQQCGESIDRVCRQCYTANWGGAEICANCGASLDIFERIAVTTTDRLSRQMKEAASFKEAEEKASRQRMEEMETIERERQIEIYRRQQKRQQEERTMLFFGVGILLALTLLTIVYFWLF